MGDQANYGREILKRQLLALTKNPPEGISVGLADDANMYEWDVMIIGPANTIHEEAYYKARLKFPKDFPNAPPEMVFSSEMWHPNIYPDGKVCISILHPPGTDKFNEFESAEERWRPILGIEAILISVLSMLVEPNTNSPANIDAAVQFRDDFPSFKKKVKKCVRKSQECAWD